MLSICFRANEVISTELETRKEWSSSSSEKTLFSCWWRKGRVLSIRISFRSADAIEKWLTGAKLNCWKCFSFRSNYSYLCYDLFMQLPFSDHYSSEEIYEARDEIRKLQTNLNKIEELYSHLYSTLDQQQRQVEQIEISGDQTQTNLEKGGFDLSRILESRRKKDKRRCLVIVCMCTTACVCLLIVINVLVNVIRTFGSQRIIKSNTWGTRSGSLWKSLPVDLQSGENIFCLFLPVSRQQTATDANRAQADLTMLRTLYKTLFSVDTVLNVPVRLRLCTINRIALRRIWSTDQISFKTESIVYFFWLFVDSLWSASEERATDFIRNCLTAGLLLNWYCCANCW